MRRIIGLALFVVAIWVGITVYTEGSSNAFGGLFERFASTPSHDRGSVLKRMEAGATSARDRQLSRIERQLGDSSVGLRDR